MLSKITLVLSAVIAIGAGACDTAVGNAGDDDTTTPDASAGSPDAVPIPAICLEAMDHSDLPWIQDNIFTKTCASSPACHQGTAPSAAGLNLEDGNSEANLVDRIATSNGLDGMNLVVVEAGDSAHSYLMVLIDHVSKGGRLDGPLPVAGTMPFNNPLMCVEKRDAIARWIDSL